MHAAIISHLMELFDQHTFISLNEYFQILNIDQLITLSTITCRARQYKIPEIIQNRLQKAKFLTGIILDLLEKRNEKADHISSLFSDSYFIFLDLPILPDLINQY